MSSTPKEKTAFRVPAAFIIVVALSLSVAPLFRDFQVTEAHGPAPRESSTSPNAQPPARNVELISRVDGTVRAVAVQGNYVYIGDGKRLVILDVSDPAAPVVVGDTDPLHGVVQDVAVVGHYAYLADE